MYVDGTDLTFALTRFQSLSHRSLECPSAHKVTHLGDGSSLSHDADGNVILAQYASGMQVKRNIDTVFVRGTEGDYWLGDVNGRWHRLD